MALEKKPDKFRYPWPPVDSPWPALDVTGMSWKELETSLGVPAKRIILYNFNTVVPAEVNWYLREWLGCNVSRDGGKNWSFLNSEGRRIRLYIPSENWLVPKTKDDDAKQAVIAVLSSENALNTCFHYQNLHLRMGDLTVVAQWIAMDHITVRLKAVSGQYASYRSSINQLKVGSLQPGKLRWKATVIHEAIHASDDILKRRINRLDLELKAYIGAAIYQWLCGVRSPMTGSTPIEAQALKLVKGYMTTAKFDPVQFMLLQAAIVGGYHDDITDDPDASGDGVMGE